MKYCTRCVYPFVAPNAIFDDEGVCAACTTSAAFGRHATPGFWEDRRRAFESLVEEVKSRPRRHENWDCVIPVSGGKDSYWQTHLAVEHGLRPLLVTYHGNNYLPEGLRNLERMREVLGVDHLVFGPGIGTLKKLNLAAFRLMGDMNWHAHAGIKIFPLRVATRFRIPLMIWGEITWTISGMYDPSDFAEYNTRTVREHDLRGYRHEDLARHGEGLTEHELSWLRFPGDDEIAAVGVRGIYIGNFFEWKANEHADLMRRRYGFEYAAEPFERTYRTMSNLDDMHENGVHDYMKFIKFGYGRASDHASKDVRDGLMTREEAIGIVRRYDHVKPRRDLPRWLEYVGISEEEFDRTADTFRDPRVWWIEDGRWWKDNLWGEASAYGEVRLPPGFDDRVFRRCGTTIGGAR